VQYLAKEEGTSHMRMVSAVGSVLPAHTTGVGKMLLASLDPEQLETLYPAGEPLAQLTETTITDRDHLLAELRDIAERGYARDHGESTMGLECIAAPVRDALGQVVAAMSVSVPQPRFTPDREPFLCRTILDGARALSQRLGHAPLDPVPAAPSR
jgi:DNA-binding IclR family transcriptional regulator